MARAMYEVVLELQEEKAVAVGAATAESPLSFTSPNNETITQYLLDELSFENQEPIDLALADRDFFERVLSIEDDLIDSYVQNRLLGTRRQRFEQRFLQTPAQRERVAMARGMHQAILELQQEAKGDALAAAAGKQPDRPALLETKPSFSERLRDFFGGWIPAAGWAMAAASLLLIAGAAYLFIESRGSSQQRLAELKEQNEKLLTQNNELQKRFETEIDGARSKIREREEELKQIQSEYDKLQQAEGGVAQMSADLPMSKGSGRDAIDIRERLLLKRGSQIIRLELRFPNPGAPSDYYEATFTNERDRNSPIASLYRLRAEKINNKDEFKLIINFSAAQLPKGKYIIEIREDTKILLGTWRINVDYK